MLASGTVADVKILPRLWLFVSALDLHDVKSSTDQINQVQAVYPCSIRAVKSPGSVGVIAIVEGQCHGTA